MNLFESGLAISGRIGLVFTWAPTVIFGTVFFLGSIFYIRRTKSPMRKRIVVLAWATIALRLLYAALLSVAQYVIWSGSEATRLLLENGIDADVPRSGAIRAISSIFPERLGYFLFYSWGRFWINALLSVGVALIWYLFLKILERRQPRFFETGEALLGFLMALVAGWPAFVLFIPLLFVSMILVSIFRLTILREQFTTLGWPLLLSTLFVLLAGGWLVENFGLLVLKI